MAEAVRKLLKDDRQLSHASTLPFMENDPEKSGFIDEKNLLRAFNKVCSVINCPPPSGTQIKDLTKKIDQKKPGKISFDEYLSLIKMMLRGHLKDLEEQEFDLNMKAASKKDENLDGQIDKQLQMFEKYLEESGISIAFQIIYTEILTKKIDEENVFTYTAMRLRQIGKEVAHLIPSNLTEKLTEN